MSITRNLRCLKIFTGNIIIATLFCLALYSTVLNAKTKPLNPAVSSATLAVKKLIGTWEGRIPIGGKGSKQYNYLRIVFLPNGQYQTFAETRQGQKRAHPKLIPSVDRGSYKILASDTRTVRVTFTQSSGKQKIETLKFISKRSFTDSSGITFQFK